MRKSIKPILSLILYIFLAFLMAYIMKENYMPLLDVGAKAPLDKKIRLLSGGMLWPKKLAKPMVINFWASWCDVCHKEMPILLALAKKYYGQIDFTFLATASDMEMILPIKQEYRMVNLAMIDDAILEAWQVHVLPTTYILDQQGFILWRKSGFSSETEMIIAIEKN